MALTPKEAFEAIQILFPGTVSITPAHQKMGWCSYGKQGNSTASSSLAPIDWGNTTAYPLPAPKWRDARPEDLSYPFKEARFRDHNVDWTVGQLAGYFPSLSYPWTNKTGTGWKHCQVRDEA